MGSVVWLGTGRKEFYRQWYRGRLWPETRGVEQWDWLVGAVFCFSAWSVGFGAFGQGGP
jgi:hypothetical protein